MTREEYLRKVTKTERNERIIALRMQGMKLADIAREVGLSANGNRGDKVRAILVRWAKQQGGREPWDAIKIKRSHF